jgi:hypothetical protein
LIFCTQRSSLDADPIVGPASELAVAVPEPAWASVSPAAGAEVAAEEPPASLPAPTDEEEELPGEDPHPVRRSGTARGRIEA